MRYCNLVGKPTSILQAMTIPDAKAAVDKEWEKLEKFPAWQEVQSKSGQKMRMNSSFPTLMGLCHLKNSDTEPKVQKYKVRVVLQGDVVKGYSGGYEVYGAGLVSVTKQRSQKFWMLS